MDSDHNKDLHLDALSLQTMASNHLCLNLSERVGWGEFTKYARELMREIRAQKISATEAPDMKIWEVLVEGHTLRLVYDDYPQMVSLESTDDGGDALLRRLEASLFALRESS